MENLKKIKTLGKVLYVLAIIARVCLYIAGVVLVMFAIMVPIIFSKITMEKNKIAVGISDTKIEVYKDNLDKLNIVINEKPIDLEKELTKTEKLSVEVIFDMLNDTTKNTVIVYLEASAILSLVSIVLILQAIKNFEKFSMNLKDKDDIFMIENSIYLRKIAKFMLISYVIALISSGILDGSITNSLGTNYNATNVVEIIALYLLSYIFAYGNSLEIKKAELVETKEVTKKTARRKTVKKSEEK